MTHFATPVDLRCRSSMTAFLEGHFRYDTMNSWNLATSYANCVKVHRLGLIPVQLERAWEMLEVAEVFEAIRLDLDRWAEARNWEWQIGWNGRSSGYLVLYRGGLDWEHAYTARCDACGKLTWHTQDTPCTRDGCDGTLRVLERPLPQIFTKPGLGVDQHEDWSEWDLEGLRERARLVQDFDRACALAVATFVGFCNTYRVEEVQVPATATVKRLVSVCQSERRRQAAVE